jgi:hypothetical protein
MADPTPEAVTPTWLPWIPEGVELATRALGLHRPLPPRESAGASWRGQARAAAQGGSHE